MSSGSGSRDAPGARQWPLAERLGLGPARQAEQLTFFELTAADQAALHGLRPVVARAADDVVERFYAHLLRFPDLEALLRTEPDRVDRLRDILRAYLLSLGDGPLDASYVERRLRVGSAHQAVGLDPTWYLGAFALYLRLVLRALVAETGDGARILPTVEALVKTIFFDMALAMRTYITGGFVPREVVDELERAAAIAADALRARQETERMKDQLAAMIVHDLKNPVSGIGMMVQLALRKDSGLSETHRGYLQQIDRTCREMTRLIQNLLEIAMIEEGKMPVVREPIVLAELVDEFAEEYHHLATQAGRTLRVDVPTSLAPAVGDRALVRRVLVNLVTNALRHSGSRTVYVEAVPGPGNDEISLRVRDHGRGIPPDLHARVFEKFAALRRSTDEPTPDTGLGLPFCKLAVEQMGGRITLASTPAETTFTVTLSTRP